MEDNNMNIHSVINVAHSSFQVSKKGEDKIFQRIAELTEKKRKKVNPILFFRYAPSSFSIVVLLVCLLPVIFFSSYTLLLPRTVTLYPALLVSDSGVVGKDGVHYSAGYKLKENDHIQVRENTVCDVTLKELASIRFFPGSEAELTRYSQLSNQIKVRLNKGSLYINKEHKKKSKKELMVQIQLYDFLMTGTRVFFEMKENNVKVVCFDGQVSMYKSDAADMEQKSSISAGEKIELTIRETGPGRLFIDSLSPEEKEIDDKNRTFSIYQHTIEEQDESVTGAEKKDSTLKNDVQKDQHIDKQENKGILTPGPENEKPEKLIFTDSKKYAHLADVATLTRTIHFYASCYDNDSAFIVTRNKLFRIMNNTVEEFVTFPFSVTFKVKPLLYKNTLILPEAHNLFLINKNTGKIDKTIPFKETEVLEDNYYPRIRGTVLYLPVRNSGYYTMDMDRAETGLSLFYKEDFPLTPIIEENKMIVGSFYENYIAALDKQGRTLWSVKLPGDSFINVLKVDDKMYTYIFEDNTDKIIEIGDNGTRMREWYLRKPLYSDILFFEQMIIGMYTDGTLFSIELLSNEIRDLIKVIKTSLSTRSWRNYYPLISGDILYTGTEDGRLIIFDLDKKSVENELTISSTESFYTPPFIVGNVLYIISNTGTLYQIF